MTGSYIGRPQSRVDGRAKVTGEAKYAAEYNVPGLVHGCIVSSTIARGRIEGIDAQDALNVPGVLHVLTHENRPDVPGYDGDAESFLPLRDAEVHFSGQPVALVVAETSELARYDAEYHVPVHADVQDIDVIFVDERDDIINPLGVKGVGEIGIVGTAAAIANAVFHATGKRVRDLPITLDKVLA